MDFGNDFLATVASSQLDLNRILGDLARRATFLCIGGAGSLLQECGRRIMGRHYRPDSLLVTYHD
jgi:hypothetical protein